MPNLLPGYGNGFRKITTLKKTTTVNEVFSNSGQLRNVANQVIFHFQNKYNPKLAFPIETLN
jgi:hypothetical protein